MNKDMIEIRWHGRGGQGAKTAALLFGEAALETGMYIQAFPEYGPERTGAPVSSYNRLSKTPIRIHSGIENPNVVIVLDPTLIGKVDVLAGLKEGGALIINTKKSPEETRTSLKVPDSIEVYTLDAYTISIETIGKAIPNTPMLGALIKTTNMLPLDHFLKSVEKKLNVKFSGKGGNIVEKNLEAIKRAYNETKGEK